MNQRNKLIDQLLSGNGNADFSDNQMDMFELSQELVKGLMRQQEHHFVLAWKGTKIPRGAKVGDVDIGWTQHGMITGQGGEQLGFYDRMAEFGGKDRDTHIMLIGTHAENVTPILDNGSVISLPKPETPRL